MRIASDGGSAASAAGVGQRVIQECHAGVTRTTGVCCSITSLTSTAQALVPGTRHGRSRAFTSYQAMALSASVITAPTLERVNELAITVIGPDRTGIVADVSEALAGVGANLTDSTMTRLRGHFAMTLICTGPTVEDAEKALAPLDGVAHHGPGGATGGRRAARTVSRTC